MERKHCFRFFFDVVCLLVFGLPLWLFNSDTVPVTKVGYFCSDTSIKYPYKNGQIPSFALFLEGFFTFAIVSCLVESFIILRAQKKLGGIQSESKNSMGLQITFEVYRVVGYLLIGSCANNFFTDVGKHTVGRLRPHFLDVCNSSVTCTADNANEYITDFTCQNTEHPLIPKEKFEDRLLDARKSFPSGHASFALFVSMYFVLYLEYRTRYFVEFRLFRHLLQVGAVAWALWVCGTRIVDFKHRFSDVAAGMIVGTFTALCTFFVYRTSMRLKKRCQQSVNGSNHQQENDVAMVGVISTP